MTALVRLLGKDSLAITTQSKVTKADVLAQTQALIDGLQVKFPNGSLQFGGATFTTATLVGLLKSLIDAIKATNEAQASAKNALIAERSVKQKALPTIRDLKQFLQTTFGNDVQALALFGLEPRKVPAKKSGEQLAAAAAKAEATRNARGTTSKKQKLAVKGNVTGVLVTPITTAGPSSQPTAAPAEPAPAPKPVAPAPVSPPPAAR